MAAANHYRFVTRWRFNATAEEIFRVISHPDQFPRWWGSVFLQADQIHPGDAQGIGRVIRFRTKGLLPYRLRWESRTIEIVAPKRVVIRATGDFVGQGSWMIEPDASSSDVMFDWNLTAEKPLLKYFSWLFNPLFRANHRWAMEQGRLGLEALLQSERDEQRAAAVPVKAQVQNRKPALPRKQRA